MQPPGTPPLLRRPASADAGQRAPPAAPPAAPPLPLLWLQPCTANAPLHRPLKRHLRKLGFWIETAEITALPTQPLHCFEFLVICVPRSLHVQVPALLAWIRASSQAPVVVLAEALEYEWSLTLLTVGADAVLDQDTPVSLILAHCRALLRRWRPDRFRLADSL